MPIATFFVSLLVIIELTVTLHVQTNMGGALQNLRMGGCDCMLTLGHKYAILEYWVHVA